MGTGTIVTIAIISFGLGLLPAFMASQKGRRFVVWWVYGALLFPVALVHALFLGMSFKDRHQELRLLQDGREH